MKTIQPDTIFSLNTLAYFYLYLITKMNIKANFATFLNLRQKRRKFTPAVSLVFDPELYLNFHPTLRSIFLSFFWEQGSALISSLDQSLLMKILLSEYENCSNLNDIKKSLKKKERKLTKLWKKTVTKFIHNSNQEIVNYINNFHDNCKNCLLKRFQIEGILRWIHIALEHLR